MTRANTTAGSVRRWVAGLVAVLLSCAGCAPADRDEAMGEQVVVQFADAAPMTLPWIKPGSFVMGTFPEEPGHRPDESPAREVTLTQGYYMGATEVTIGQWRAVMGTTLQERVAQWLHDDTQYDFPNGRMTIAEYMGMDPAADAETYLANEDNDLPMYFVSWYDALAFCERLTEREHAANRIPEGARFTLPTEAQWEYACRAGSTTPTFAGGIESIATISWFVGNSADDYTGKPLPGSRAKAGPRAVAGKQPNAWGLYDMPGNLWEWCLDWYGPYPGDTEIDPAGPASGETRVNRGGSWGSGADDERSARRAGNPPAEASAYRGFRVVLLSGSTATEPQR